MKILSEILSADPRPVALIAFFVSALCGGIILIGHPSADFISDPYLTGLIAFLSGIFGILFLINPRVKIINGSTFISMTVFYYLASASIMNGHLYDSVIHLALGLSMSWVFIHQRKLCMSK